MVSSDDNVELVVLLVALCRGGVGSFLTLLDDDDASPFLDELAPPNLVLGAIIT